MFTPYPDKNDKSIYVIPPAIKTPRNRDLRPSIAVMEGSIEKLEDCITEMQKSTDDFRTQIRELGKLIQEIQMRLDNRIP